MMILRFFIPYLRGSGLSGKSHGEVSSEAPGSPAPPLGHSVVHSDIVEDINPALYLKDPKLSELWYIPYCIMGNSGFISLTVLYRSRRLVVSPLEAQIQRELASLCQVSQQRR